MFGEHGHGLAAALGQHLGDGGLEAGGDVGAVLVGKLAQVAHHQAHGVFQPGKRKITAWPALHRPRQGEPGGIAPGRPAFHRRSAGIAQRQQLGHLVEGFAGGVVDGGPQAAVAAHPFHRQQLAMAARDQQKQIGKIDARGQAGRQGVAFQVVDGDERLAYHHGQRLGGGHPHHDAADQPGAAGGGDGVHGRQRLAGLRQGLGDQPVQMLQMGPGRHLGHHAAIGSVLFDLRQHHIGQDGAVVGHHGGGGFIATGFQPENQHRFPYG